MRFDTASLDANLCARLITAAVVPRPIAWIVTQTIEGRRNAAPFSFFNALCSWPPVLGIGMQPRPDGTPKDTLANIRATHEFVVNLVNYTQASAMNITGGAYPPNLDEITLAGLEVERSAVVAPPRIVGSPVAFECCLREEINVANGRVIVLGDVLSMHIEDDALLTNGPGKVDAGRLDLVARMHGGNRYLRTSDVFTLDRIDPPDNDATVADCGDRSNRRRYGSDI